MDNPEIHTIDLNFKGRSGTIGCYLIPHSGGCILVETGPCSTIESLLTGINHLGYKIPDITDVLLTHIHLDHAGAAGWWAEHGARIHVHELGAPHLINPEKLIASATRLYGDLMDTLWGKIIPINSASVSVVGDQEVIHIGDLSILAMDVPGHASHHLAYLVGDACFTGDIGGIRLSPHKYLSLPMPPPDLHLEKWRGSIARVQQHHPRRIVPTHFGVYPDAEWHLQAVIDELDEVEIWMEEIMELNPSLEDLRRKFIEFEQTRADKYKVKGEVLESQQIANPSYTSADGILRYWNKYRRP